MSGKIKFEIRHPEAILPHRAHPTDVGMDLTAISMKKTLPHDGVLYDTGLAVTPPDGYYFEIIPRSSFSKTGYIQPHGIGIIDPTYTGNLYIALRKHSPNVPDLQLPFCYFQLVLRKLSQNFEVIQVESLEDTERGSGGFGSTG